MTKRKAIPEQTSLFRTKTFSMKQKYRWYFNNDKCVDHTVTNKSICNDLILRNRLSYIKYDIITIKLNFEEQYTTMKPM